MELNTINKTGTWSETADRINSNFSKISIEVEEIKQNGGGGSGGGGDVTNADHATSAYTLDENTPVLDWFLSALKDDDAQGIINFLKGLKIAGNLINISRKTKCSAFTKHFVPKSHSLTQFKM